MKEDSRTVGWKAQGALMGAFAALGLGVALLDLGVAVVGPMSGYTGFLTLVYWAVFCLYALASTLAFNFLQRSAFRFVLGNLALLAATGGVLVLYVDCHERAVEESEAQAARNRQTEASRCGTLVSWKLVDVDEASASAILTIDPHHDGHVTVRIEEGTLPGRGIFRNAFGAKRDPEFAVKTLEALNVTMPLRRESSPMKEPFGLSLCCILEDRHFSSPCTFYSSGKLSGVSAQLGSAEYPLPPPQ